MTETINFDTMTKEQIKELLTTKFNFVGAEAFDKKDQLIAVYNALLKTKMVDNDTSTSVRSKMKMEGKIEFIKNKLNKEKSFSIMIPLNGEEMGAYQEFIINGARWNVLKGVFVDVPETIYIMYKKNVEGTFKAGQDQLANRDEEHAKFCGMN